MNIYQMMERHNELVREARELLLTAQLSCSHPIEARLTTTHRINDEWDSHAHYSTEHRCQLCQKLWEESLS